MNKYKEEAMIKIKDIKASAERIAREFQPQRIVLFGSYAWGQPTPDSDVDLLIILPFQGKSWKIASEIRKRIHPSFPLDLIVRTANQLRQRLIIGDDFFMEIVQKGKVLYESSNGRMD